MCTNTEYIQKQVNINDLIYIDTCSLLDTNRLENFINNSKEYFIESNKKIRIHNAVLNELAKFRCSSTLSKKEQAEKALDIIADNKDLFIVENEDKTCCDQFADPKLLETLLKRRRVYKQLLISNDKDLTYDAYSFNNLESFYGNKINVCYLNSAGYLKMCDCVRQSYTDNSVILEPVIQEKIVEKTVTVKEKMDSGKKYVIPLITFCSGVAIGTFRKPIMNAIKGIDLRKIVCC